jgi:hypothetical protein
MKTFLEFISEEWQDFLPPEYTTLQPENLNKPVLDYQGSAWIHNGRISKDAASGQKLYQYQPKVSDPREQQRNVWADVNGNVVDNHQPEPEDTVPRQQRGANANIVPPSYPVK